MWNSLEHVAGCGNERVASLASRAPITGTLKLRSMDILGVLRDIMRRSETALTKQLDCGCCGGRLSMYHVALERRQGLVCDRGTSASTPF